MAMIIPEVVMPIILPEVDADANQRLSKREEGVEKGKGRRERKSQVGNYYHYLPAYYSPMIHVPRYLGIIEWYSYLLSLSIPGVENNSPRYWILKLPTLPITIQTRFDGTDWKYHYHWRRIKYQ